MKKTAGFTLVELTIAMAISASLTAIAFQGFSTVRGQAEFTNAIEGLKEKVTGVRTEAYTTVNTDAITNSGDVVLGRMLTIRKATPSQILVYRLTASSDPVAPVVRAPVLDRIITLPYDVTYNGAANVVNIAFIRSALDGTNFTAVDPTGLWAATPTYANLTTRGAVINIPLTDLKGRTATLDIDPINNSIGRTF